MIRKSAATRIQESLRIQYSSPPDQGKAAGLKILEPTLPAVNVYSDKGFIALREIHDPFDDSDHVHEAIQRKAAQHGNQQHGHALFLITEHEFVDSQTTDQDTQDPGHNFLVSARRFPVLHHRLAIHWHGRLNRFVAWLVRLLIICLGLIGLAANQRQYRLTMQTALCKVIILRAAFGTKNRHGRLDSARSESAVWANHV